MSDTTEKEVKGCIAVLVGFVPMLAYLVFAEGFVLSKLWLWYAVPLGMRPLHWHTCAMAAGAYSLLRASSRGAKDERSDIEQLGAFLTIIAYPWALLLLGWWWS